MGNLGKYYLKGIVISIWSGIIIVVPVLLSYYLLNTRWAIVVGLIGLFVYYKTYSKIMKKIRYDLLSAKQKRISFWIELSIASILVISSFFLEMKLYLRLLFYVVILYIIYIELKKFKDVGK